MNTENKQFYFRIPKSRIVKNILFGLQRKKTISLPDSPSYFITELIKSFNLKNQKREKIYSRFHYLKKKEILEIRKKGFKNQIFLTEKGKIIAHFLYLFLNKRTKKWDGKWRLIFFDVAEFNRSQRDALREKLKLLNYFPLQKSVWVSPFDCQKEIDFLIKIFGLSKEEIKTAIAERIDGEESLKKIFRV